MWISSGTASSAGIQSSNLFGCAKGFLYPTRGFALHLTVLYYLKKRCCTISKKKKSNGAVFRLRNHRVIV